MKLHFILFIGSISLLLGQSIVVKADPLILTPAEIQKLKKYFPNEEPSMIKDASQASALQINKGTNPHQENQNSTTTLSTTSINNNDSANALDSANMFSEGDTYVALVRYAWQQLYAPIRLLTNPWNINRVPMQAYRIDSALVYGDKIYAHPVASWSLNNIYVTAIELRNKYSHPTTISPPQDICGTWKGAVIYPQTQLAAAGDKLHDSTTLFLLSDQPYAKASEVCHVSA